jgi:formylglycine-generating enzyme
VSALETSPPDSLSSPRPAAARKPSAIRFGAATLGVLAGLAGLLALGNAAGSAGSERNDAHDASGDVAATIKTTSTDSVESADDSFAEPDAATQPATPAWAKVSRRQRADAAAHNIPVAFENRFGMRFVLVPSGTFTMGSPKGEPGHGENDAEHEPLPHVETLREPCYLAITEVTNAQFRRFRPEHRSGEAYGRSLDADAQPVVDVSCDDARAFAAWLSASDAGRTYRLPSETEWERAARGGTTTAFWWGSSSAEASRHANLADASAARVHSCEWAVAEDDGFAATAPVASYDTNPFGLYDMLGNVFEWCDPGSGATAAAPRVASASVSLCVARGGSWNECPTGCRAAHRLQTPGTAGAKSPTIGFRVAVSIPGAPPTPTRNE